MEDDRRMVFDVFKVPTAPKPRIVVDYSNKEIRQLCSAFFRGESPHSSLKKYLTQHSVPSHVIHRIFTGAQVNTTARWDAFAQRFWEPCIQLVAAEFPDAEAMTVTTCDCCKTPIYGAAGNAESVMVVKSKNYQWPAMHAELDLCKTCFDGIGARMELFLKEILRKGTPHEE